MGLIGFWWRLAEALERSVINLIAVLVCFTLRIEVSNHVRRARGVCYVWWQWHTQPAYNNYSTKSRNSSCDVWTGATRPRTHRCLPSSTPSTSRLQEWEWHSSSITWRDQTIQRICHSHTFLIFVKHKSCWIVNADPLWHQLLINILSVNISECVTSLKLQKLKINEIL